MPLIAAYAFDEGSGSSAAELSGGASIAGVPAWDAGLHGSAMRVSGGAIGPTISPFAVDTDFTLMFDLFILGDGASGLNMVVSGSVFGNVQILNAGGQLEWYLGPYPTQEFVPQGTWLNLAFTADGVNRKVYVNGALASGGTSSSTPRSGTDPIQLGGYIFGGYVPNVLYDNLRIYDEALAASEIAAVAGTPVAEAAASTFWWWDGSAKQPATLKGWWDGAITQPASGRDDLTP